MRTFYAFSLICLNSTVIISFSIFTHLLLSTAMYKNLNEYVGVSFLARVVSVVSLSAHPKIHWENSQIHISKHLLSVVKKELELI